MIRNKEKSKIAFNQQAATYDEDIKGQHARSLYPVLLKKLSSLDFNAALDLGCGTGAVMQAILQSFPDKRVYGIDISENMLQKAKEKLQDNAYLTLGDSEHLPYANETFDVVYCNDSFHHYPAPEKVIAEVYRVLKPTGSFIISDCWQPFFGRIIMNAFMRFSSEGDVKMYSKHEICRLLGLHFQNVIWQKANHTSFIVCSTK